ncbi:MAG: hypothetical protein HONBIEJF_02053 [Fimbriimonadaceae bacterium]|nr:hypothetical protein [Fimbriimonadaceae bacterium]
MDNQTAEWYYVGHYGQLGPLTLLQIEELVRDGVIERDTYVWRNGMSNWTPAGQMPELATAMQVPAPGFMPPPIPPAPMQTPPVATPTAHIPYGSSMSYPMAAYRSIDHLPISDRNRIVAGLLQLIIPGAGRLYLGYMAHGVLQLLTMMCFFGWIWSVVDGIIMLSGGVKLDGYGRRLLS